MRPLKKIVVAIVAAVLAVHFVFAIGLERLRAAGQSYRQPHRGHECRDLRRAFQARRHRRRHDTANVAPPRTIEWKALPMSSVVQQYVMIALGGALGAIARHQVAVAIQSRMASAFPWGTFVVNISGCFVMGLTTTILAGKIGVHQNWRFLVPIGFIGAYTTFSTFEFETYRAITGADLVTGMANVLASVIVGYLALWLGVIAARLT